MSDQTQALPTNGQPAFFDPGATPPPERAQGVPIVGPTVTPGPPQPSATQAPQQGQPQQGIPTAGAPGAAPASSDPTVAATKPQIDPRPYAWLAENDPARRAMVDQAAAKTGADPIALAGTWNVESGGVLNPPRGAAGEVGPGQILPSTGADPRFNPGGRLDINDPQQNLELTGRILSYYDGKYGRNSPSVQIAYNRGEGTANELADHPERASAYPIMQQRLARFYGGADMNNVYGSLTHPSGMTPQGVMAAGQQGPQGVLKYIAATKSPEVGMSDAWRQADAALQGLMASRGDVAGMQHAHDYVTQMAHVGTNQFLMQAAQHFDAGDPVGAAQALAKAHAFFPDESMGKFSVDQAGNVWGHRFDEHTGQPIGQPFQITREGLQEQLAQTSDPNKFVALVQEQQKNNAAIRHTAAMGDYYGNLLDARQQVAETRAGATTDAAGIRAGASEYGADLRAGRTGASSQGGVNQLARSADKEADTLYGQGGEARGSMSDIEAGQAAEVYHTLRTGGGVGGGVTGPQAHAVTMGLKDGRLAAVQGQDGNYVVVDPKTRQPLALLPKSIGDRLRGTQAAQAPTSGAPVPGGRAAQQPTSATPIGAGASSDYARGSGITQNLTGTVQPEALPISGATPATQPAP